MNFVKDIVFMDLKVIIIIDFIIITFSMFNDNIYFSACLVLFLTAVQKYDHNTSIIIFHIFMVFVSTVPVFGAILADSYWGKYK